MRLANIGGRPTAVLPHGGIDIVKASNGQFTGDFNDVIERWNEVEELASGLSSAELVPVDETQLLVPVPWPRQVFAVGLNYQDHAAEAKRAVPQAPMIFTKYPSCLTGPTAEVKLPSGRVDWEVELVVVIGKRADFAAEENAWSHIAGVMVGQDISERDVQRSGPVPQFSLGKSFRGFGPTGPYVVPVSDLRDPSGLDLGCSIDDEVVQSGNTRDMIFGVPELIARLSRICPLLPGDLIFTGTPGGVGVARNPQRFLQPGENLVSWIDGVGELSNRMVAE